ncbi:MAG: hypothetical protein R3E36_12885 [Nitrosomonas sp.]
MKRIAPSVNVISHAAQYPMIIAPYAGFVIISLSDRKITSD